ncbi:hypothetical protein IB262_30710 [Ensifer sp. ENS02]|uniref:hypothetical protein n=1 Tax=Ensifer sp. ENS02 TaxID=2769290 RepID=UPI00177EE6F8|nr:hypothetical protein [Ensifer sp. ENS02]MBD9524258.1 hypothetical protein [Ensifer sp. ENS02]
MKKPQRKFVVEFKSGRRLTKGGANSIWGNTDLKAVAREVEDQSSHLFAATKTTEPDVTEPTRQPGAHFAPAEPVVEGVVPEALTNPINADSPASPSAIIDEISQPDPTPVEPVTVSKINQVAEPEQTPLAPPAVRKTVKASKKAPRPQAPAARAVTAATTPDDLATLEAENKHLRQLLTSQLRAQNAELKRMLERF